MEDKDKREEEQGFRIVDRRRFDSDGNAKGDAAPAEESRRPAERRSEASGSQAQSQPPVQQEITFSSFVMSLATQALIQLGDMPPPQGLNLPVDREAAKQSIDILSMLEEKTRGNLDQEEGGLIEEILHNLRMSYIRKK